MSGHFQADAVSHGLKLVAHARDKDAAHLFLAWKRRGDVAVGGQYRGVDSQAFQAVGDLEGLVGRAANVGEKCLNSSKDVQIFLRFGALSLICGLLICSSSSVF